MRPDGKGRARLRRAGPGEAAAGREAGAGTRSSSAAGDPRFESETTEQGEQTLVPGVAPITLAERLAMRAAQPLEPRRAQRPCNHGLFDSNARAQLELFAALRADSETPPPGEDSPPLLEGE